MGNRQAGEIGLDAPVLCLAGRAQPGNLKVGDGAGGFMLVNQIGCRLWKGHGRKEFFERFNVKPCDAEA